MKTIFFKDAKKPMIRVFTGTIMIIGVLIVGCAGEIATYRFAKEGSDAYSTADYTTALQQWQAGLEQARLAENNQDIGLFLFNIGLAYDKLSQYQDALAYYRQALVVKRELGDRRDEANVLDSIGIVYGKLSLYQQSLQHYQQASKIRLDWGDTEGDGQSLNNIGTVYQHLGQYQEALQYYRQALEIKRRILDNAGEGRILNNIGSVLWNLGQYDGALDNYLQALTIRREIEDKHGEGSTLNNIGGVYWNFGQYMKTLDYYYEALNLRREIGDKRGEASTLNNIALTNWKLEEYEEALDDYQQALRIRREIGDKRGEGSTLTNIGVIYESRNQYQQALDYYRQSLTIRRAIGDKRGEGITLNHLGQSYYQLGQYQDAFNTFQTSIQLNGMLGTAETLWIAQSGLGVVEVRLKQLESAITHYEQALDTIETLRAGLAEKEHKLSFMRDKLHVYDELIELLRSSHQVQPNKGYDRKALEIFERKQGRIFLEEMGKSGARLFNGLPESVKAHEEQLETQLYQLRQKLADERAQAAPHHAFIQSLEQQAQTLDAEEKTLRASIYADYPDYYALRYPQPVKPSELQETVLQTGEVMLVYGVMHDKTLLWAISQQNMQLFTLPEGEQALQQKIATVRETLGYDWRTARGLVLGEDFAQNSEPEVDIRFPQASHDLYTLLFPDTIRNMLTAHSTLNIVPTGPLYALPFEILLTHPVTEPQDAHYLIEDIPVNYLSSASLLKTLRDAKNRRTTLAPYPVLAFAHPVYQLEASEDPNTVRGIRSQDYRKLLGNTLAELPETAAEANAVAAIFHAPPDSDPVQLRWNASYEKIFEFNAHNRLDDYQYLLFAMHGVMPGEVSRLTQSALLLSDNYLQTADVFSLKLNAKLVALSACNTGRGRRERGEGVIGLTRAFMYAGTPSIAVTLWSVESFSAKALSIGMFDNLKNGHSPAQALRAIKMRMIQGQEGEDYQLPYYWAPYVVFGDGK